MDEKDLIARLRDYRLQVLRGFRHISRLKEADLIQEAITALAPLSGPVDASGEPAIDLTNHHNAARCPYCNPLLDTQFMEMSRLKADAAYWKGEFDRLRATAAVPSSPAQEKHEPPAVHHLCGPNVIGVTGPPHASWCYHDRTWVDGAAQQDDYTCSACGTKISTNISEWSRPALPPSSPCTCGKRYDGIPIITPGCAVHGHLLREPSSPAQEEALSPSVAAAINRGASEPPNPHRLDAATSPDTPTHCDTCHQTRPRTVLVGDGTRICEDCFYRIQARPKR